MDGQAIVARVSALKPDEVIALRYMAGRGDPASIIGWLAYCALRRARELGDESPEAAIAALVDRLTVKIEA